MMKTLDAGFLFVKQVREDARFRTLPVVILTGVVTAIGVFVGPYFAESLRTKRTARRDHYTKIKQNCLILFKDSIQSLLLKEVSHSGSLGRWFFYGPQEEPYRPPTLTITPPLIIEPTLGGSWQDPYRQGELQLYDPLLYDDLGNHFSGLKENLKKMESEVLSKDGPKFLYAKWYITKSLFYGLNGKIDQQKHNLGDTVKGGLFFAADEPTKNWSDTYNWICADNTIDLIKEILQRPEVVAQIREYKHTQKAINDGLSSLLAEVERTIESQKELKGKCPYV